MWACKVVEARESPGFSAVAGGEWAVQPVIQKGLHPQGIALRAVEDVQQKNVRESIQTVHPFSKCRIHFHLPHRLRERRLDGGLVSLGERRMDHADRFHDKLHTLIHPGWPESAPPDLWPTDEGTKSRVLITTWQIPKSASRPGRCPISSNLERSSMQAMWTAPRKSWRQLLEGVE